MAVHESVIAIAKEDIVQEQIELARELVDELEEDVEEGSLSLLDLLDALGRLGYYLADAKKLGRNLASDAYIVSLAPIDE